MAVYGCGVEFAILICTTSLGFLNYFFLMGFVLLYMFFFWCVCLFYYCISIHYIVFGCAISFCCMCFFLDGTPTGPVSKNKLLQIKRLIIILHALLKFVVLVVIVHIPFRWRFKMI